MLWFIRRHAPWITCMIVGFTLVAGGLFFIIAGNSTRSEVRQQLVDEQITTSSEAAVPGVLVDDAKSAKAQADLIKKHTLGTWGPYSELPRDDPRRVTFIDGVALRTALNLAVVGFGVTDLVIGAGVIILVAGAVTVVLGTPTLYYVAGLVVPPVNHSKQA